MNITVTIDGKPLDLDIQSQDEEADIRLAVRRINELINEFRKFQIEDKEKLLTMCLLEFSHQLIRNEKESKVSSKDENLINQIDNMLDTALKN